MLMLRPWHPGSINKIMHEIYFSFNLILKLNEGIKYMFVFFIKEIPCKSV